MLTHLCTTGCRVSIFKFTSHSKDVVRLATKFGWLPGAKYSNLRDVKSFRKVGFIDIDWKHYDFEKHLEAVIKTKPLFTVAKDIEHIDEIDEILRQAKYLSKYAKQVIIVPKCLKLKYELDDLPGKFLLGYSVPTQYGGTKIPIKYFRKPVHLLGGRPDIQRKLAKKMHVVSIDCNRFTLDAKFGDYFDGQKFTQHPKGGYVNCLSDSIMNINKLWDDY